MHSTSAARERGTPTTLAHAPPVSSDPDDLVPELEHTLSVLTTLELRHEIEVDCLEEWTKQVCSGWPTDAGCDSVV